MSATAALQTEVLTALAERRTMSTAEIRLFIWLMATGVRGQRYLTRDFAVALELSLATVQQALKRLRDQGMIASGQAPRQQAQQYSAVLDPALWKPSR